MIKEIKRGYVKWTDEDGVFHKEPLAEHKDMLAKATPEQQLQAEEVRRGLADGEKQMTYDEADAAEDVEKTLAALKKAPEEVILASQLATNDKGDPIPEAVEPMSSEDLEPVKVEEPAHDDGNDRN